MASMRVEGLLPDFLGYLGFRESLSGFRWRNPWVSWSVSLKDSGSWKMTSGPHRSASDTGTELMVVRVPGMLWTLDVLIKLRRKSRVLRTWAGAM